MSKTTEALAREAGMPFDSLGLHTDENGISLREYLQIFEALVRADEREKCAKRADDQWVSNPNISGGDAIMAGHSEG